MTCNLDPSISGGLVEFWLLADPGGPIITGSTVQHQGGEDSPTDNIDLVLERTDRNTGGFLQVGTGWIDEPVGAPPKDCFNGRGTAMIPAGVLSVAALGAGITLAVRFWTGAGQVQGAPAGPLAKPMQLLGLAGQYSANPTVESGFSVFCPDPTAASPELWIRQWDGVSATETQIGGAVLPTTPCLVIVILERVAGVPGIVRVTTYINGVVVAGQPTALVSLLALSRVTFGDIVESDGGFSEGSLWSRPLTPSEITSLGETLECLVSIPPAGGGGPGSADPLLNPDGTSAIHPEWPVPRTDPVGVLATGGEQRHTRRVHEVVPREYELRWRNASAPDVEYVRQALSVTRGGVRPTRWRHPVDDPAGPVSTAPRWHILNASEASEFVVERGRGGHTAAMTLRLREVV